MSFNTKFNDRVNKPDPKFDEKKPPSKSQEVAWSVKQKVADTLAKKK